MKLFNVILCLVLLLPLAAVLSAADTLDIYVIDVEGGKAMIVQNPSGTINANRWWYAAPAAAGQAGQARVIRTVI